MAKIIQRKIIHLDLDAFFCAVEELSNPELKGKIFVVGGNPQQRGVVSSCSYPARRIGIHAAMPMRTAIKIYPPLIIIHPHFKQYSEYSHQVMLKLHDFSSLIEQISIDEAFLDVSDVEDVSSIAQEIQHEINDQIKLPCSLGIASNKLVAKIATDVGKSRSKSHDYPNVINYIKPGTEQIFLSPLPTNMMFGIGQKTALKLQTVGINTIGDLANTSEKELVKLFGKFGVMISLWSKGEDNRPIISSHEVKSISRETTFTNDIQDIDLLIDILRKLTNSVCLQCYEEKSYGNTIRIKIRWSDFSTISRQETLPNATADSQLVFETAKKLLLKNLDADRSVRLIGIGISNIKHVSEQMSFWESKNQKKEKFYNTLIDLQTKYGKDKIHLGDKPHTHQP